MGGMGVDLCLFCIFDVRCFFDVALHCFGFAWLACLFASLLSIYLEKRGGVLNSLLCFVIVTITIGNGNGKWEMEMGGYYYFC